MSAPWSACFRETSCPFSDLLKSWLAISIVNFICHSMSSLKMFAVIVTLYFVLLSSSTSYHLPNLWFSYHWLFFWHIKYVGLQNLIQRNEQLYGSGNTPSGGVALPFILVQVNMFWSLWFFFSFGHNRLSKWISHPFAHDLELNVRDICSFASRPGLMQPWKSRYQKICSWCILISIGQTWMILFLPYWNRLLFMTAL